MADVRSDEQTFIDYMSNFVSPNDLIAIEKKIAETQKQVQARDTKIKKLPQFSQELSAEIYQRDLNVLQLLNLKALLMIASNNYSPVAGGFSKTSKQETAIAAKQKGDPAALLATASTLDSEIAAGGTSRKYVQAPSSDSAKSVALGKGKPTSTAPTSTKPGQMTGTATAAEAPETTMQPTSTLPAPKNPSARNKIGAVTKVSGGKTGGKTGGGKVTTPSTKDVTQPGAEQTAASDVLAGLDIDTLKKQYPGYAWVWDLNPKFNDTKKLWADFLNGDITTERFNNLIGQSSWYTDQRTIGETRRIKNRYGDILDPGTMAKLVNESLRFDYEDDELDNAFFTSALARNVITGEYIDGRAAKTALASNVANSYRNYAKSMFLSTDDQEIEDVLTGKMTAEDFSRTKRQIAQATYKNWADLLNDPAMTMEKIVKPWKDMAASVLELDPTQIDMTKPQFSVAYAGSPDGKMGAMGLGEWYVKLRTDATYGWDKTTQAKQEARELGYNIAKTFGKA